MSGVVKSMDAALKSMNLEKVQFATNNLLEFHVQLMY